MNKRQFKKQEKKWFTAHGLQYPIKFVPTIFEEVLAKKLMEGTIYDLR